MAHERWTTSNKAVSHLGYHLIWCTKYRRKVLVDRAADRVKELLTEKAATLGLTIETMEVMPDHVHLFVKAQPIHSPHYLVQQLKGTTSFHLRSEFPSLTSRLPTLWTRSYYCVSVGHIFAATIARSSEDQKRA